MLTSPPPSMTFENSQPHINKGEGSHYDINDNNNNNDDDNKQS